MENTYLLKDWTSASTMRNQFDRNRRITVDVILSTVSDKGAKEVTGHKITIYNKKTSEILSAFYVECSDETVFSYTKEEAIQVLNLFGFNCLYVGEITIPQQAIEILRALYEMGYRYVLRSKESFTGGNIQVWVAGELAPTTISAYMKVPKPYRLLKDVLADEDLYPIATSFEFLTFGVVIAIETLL